VPVSPIRDLNPAVSLKAAIAASKAAPLAADFDDMLSSMPENYLLVFLKII
jgi:hypothetical protein